MSDITCFWLEPVAFARHELRRYHPSGDAADTCPLPHGYHDARVVIDERAARPLPATLYEELDRDFPLDDPRWPTACACGYVFVADDARQSNHHRLYARSDGGTDTTIEGAPAGAMWDAKWWPRKGPDGLCLVVKTPGGDWIIDGPSKNGGGWTRRGTPPKITVDPSILAGWYHGWLRDGVLVDA